MSEHERSDGLAEMMARNAAWDETQEQRDASWSEAFAEALGTSGITPPAEPDAKAIRTVLVRWARAYALLGG